MYPNAKFESDLNKVADLFFDILENPTCPASIKIAVAAFSQTTLKELYPNDD